MMQKKQKEFLKNRDSFIKELETLINKCCIDSFTDTPDFILADYLWRQIEIWRQIKILENLNDPKNWCPGNIHDNHELMGTKINKTLVKAMKGGKNE